jgi:hypothetical protein
MKTATKDRFRTSVPLGIPGVIEARAWEGEAFTLWLREVVRSLEGPPAPDTQELAGGRVRTTIELLRVGSFNQVGAGGKFDVTEAVLDQMVANFAADQARGVGSEPSSQLPRRSGHAVFVTVGHPENLDGATAAGWIESVWRLGGRLFGRILLNATTVTAIRADELRYFSPEFALRAFDEAGKMVGPKLLSGAITNFPFLKGMMPFQLAAVLDGSDEDETMTLTKEQAEKLFDDKVASLKDDLVKELGTQVGSAVKAQLAEVQTSLTKTLSEKLKPATDPKGSSSADADLKTLSEDVKGLKATVEVALGDNKRLSDALGQNKAALDARDINDLVQEGLDKGKLVAGDVPNHGTDKWDPSKWLSDGAGARFSGIKGLRLHVAQSQPVLKVGGSQGPGHDGSNDLSPGWKPDEAEAQRLGFKDVADWDRCVKLADSRKRSVA